MNHSLAATMRRASAIPTRAGARAAWAAILALPLAATFAWAADDAGVAGSYLRYGSSARSLALGNAVSGLADDVATAYWNPAGLTQLRTMELTAMGATLFADTRYTFFALGLPTERFGTFAFSGFLVNSGEFERASLYEDLDETFSEKEGSFAVSYARGGRLCWGVTIKSVSQDIGGAQGAGTGADVGLYFRPHRNLSLGGLIQNALTPEITLDEEPEELARSIRGGAALRFLSNRLLVVSDLVKTEHMATSFRSGLEAWPLRAVGLRAGYDSAKEQISFGTGLRWENWQFDYAFIDHDLGSSHVMSATLRFGVPYGVKLHRDRDLFSPSGTDRDVTFDIETALRGGIDSWQLEIRDEQGRAVKSLAGNGAPPAGVTWSGEDDQGRLVADGTYQAQVVVIDHLGQEWDYETSVQVLGFRNRTRVPIRVEIDGAEPSEGDTR
jgi:hypothetical protein